MKTKYSNLLRKTILGTLGAISLPLIVNDSDYILINIVGIAILALTGYLHTRWFGNDLSEYANEFFDDEK